MMNAMSASDAIRRWQMQQNNSSVRCITWTHANWAKSRRSASPSWGSNIRRAYLHHIRSTEVRGIGGHVASQRQHDNLHHSLARAVNRHSCTRRASWHRCNHPGNKQQCTLIWQSFVDDGVVQQSKLSNNAHEALSRSEIELNTQ